MVINLGCSGNSIITNKPNQITLDWIPRQYLHLSDWRLKICDHLKTTHTVANINSSRQLVNPRVYIESMIY